jgi:hypothetical protein
MSGLMVWLSAVREQIIKSFEYPAILFLLITILISVACYVNRKQNYVPVKAIHLFLGYIFVMAVFVLVYLKPDVNSYILPNSLILDKNHFIITVLALIAGVFTLLIMKKKQQSSSLLFRLQLIFLVIAAVSGLLMMIKFDAIYQIVRIAYTLFDVSVVLSVITSIIYLIKTQFQMLIPEVQK